MNTYVVQNVFIPVSLLMIINYHGVWSRGHGFTANKDLSLLVMNLVVT